jgi:hypothetical protein
VHRRRALFAVFVGVAAGLYAWAGIVIHHGMFVPDFQFFWSSARILASGHNPYTGFPTPVPDPLYYPLPTVLAAFALAWLPLAIAAGVAVGLSATLLAWVIPSWRWPLFASAAFVMAASQGQWSPLIVVGALVPAAGFLAVLKPNLGLAAFAYRPTVRGIALAGLALVLSLAVLPSWPWDWIRNLRTLEGHPPPLFTVSGSFLWLALLRWRTPEARLLLAMSAVPQLLFFADQLPLWLIPRTRSQTSLLSGCSLIGYGAFYLSLRQGQQYVPAAAPFVLGSIYLPALALVLFRPGVSARKAES